ncbi:MFS transporter [Curtobacterium sp. MCBD17_003]|uniref:MFS transporter n=1 Tax=Curtobacterium sp. MCBD17_003 TaxID=2175667 RepID=UPI000DAA4EB5|nr:MFS transporter [Curtobacterium sp. MCBD17_003]WIE54055.1 MFS transporter [Curtobacterium sp. MCBD17_003]
MTSEQTATTGAVPTSTAGAARRTEGGVRNPSPIDKKDHRWIVLTVIGIAQIMVVLDATIVNIALPSAQQDLGFGTDQRQWVVTAYSLAFGSLLLLGGRLADLFGRKNTFIIGLIGFALASMLGGLAGTFGLLVAARALQGVFGALLAPAALSLLTTTFTDMKERARAFGIFGAIAGSGAAIGLLLGGVLTEYASWRWCLYVNLVIAAFAFVGALLFIPRPVAAPRPRIDYLGVVTITAGLVGIVYGFSNAETNGWNDGLTYVCLAAGVVLIALFVLIETRVAHPLMPLRVVLDRDRGGSLLAMGLVAIGMFGIFLFLTYYLEQTLGFSSLKTGLAFLPMPLSIMFSSTILGTRLLPRVGPKVLIFIGGLVAAVGLLLLTRTQLDSAYAPVVLPGLIVIGLGMGLIFSSAFSTATSGVARQDAGVASAMVNTMQQIGGSIGTALLSTIFADVVRDQLTGTKGSQLDQARAALDGYHTAFFISSGVLVLVALAGGLIINRQRVRLAKLQAASSDITGSIPTAAH